MARGILTYFRNSVNGSGKNLPFPGIPIHIRPVEKGLQMRKTKLDDGFHSYLTEGAALVGDPGIPMLVDMHNTDIPRGLIPFEKCMRATNKRQYVHFYMHDRGFSRVLTATNKYLDLLRSFDGVITPDCTMLVGQAPCLLQTNTYFNRAVGVYLQRNGIPVIPNIRWSDEKSFPYCFLGVPKHTIVAISTHGCIRSNKEKELFKSGLNAMLTELSPTDVVVHGYMPDCIFSDFHAQAHFHRYASHFEKTHPVKEAS